MKTSIHSQIKSETHHNKPPNNAASGHEQTQELTTKHNSRKAQTLNQLRKT